MPRISKQARNVLRKVESEVRKGSMRPYRTPVTSRMSAIAARPISSIAALSQKVSKLSKTVNSTTSDVKYGAAVNNPIGNVAGNNTYILPLSQYSGWARVFGTDADDESNHKALWTKSNFDFQIDTNTERNLLNYTFFVVSLTKLGMEELFTPATGGLAGPLGTTGLTNLTHYYSGITGMTYLNLKYFNIHQVKRFRTGSPGSLATDTTDLSKRWSLALKHNNGKGHTLQNAKGDWKAIPSPQLASQNYYVLLFNNDSTADASVFFKMNALHSLKIA